jgi:hypothetical protein
MEDRPSMGSRMIWLARAAINTVNTAFMKVKVRMYSTEYIILILRYLREQQIGIESTFTSRCDTGTDTIPTRVEVHPPEEA